MSSSRLASASPSLSAFSHFCISESWSNRRSHSARSASGLILTSWASSGHPSSKEATRLACSRLRSGSIDRNQRSMRVWKSRMPSSHSAESSDSSICSSVPMGNDIEAFGLRAGDPCTQVSSPSPGGMLCSSPSLSLLFRFIIRRPDFRVGIQHADTRRLNGERPKAPTRVPSFAPVFTFLCFV